MTQYTKMVEEFAIMEEALKWSRGAAYIHSHSMDSMYYDDRPDDTAGMTKSVTDIEYNAGHIERFQNGKLIHTFGKKMTDEQLLNAFSATRQS
jgi:hypothetical protein